MTEFNQDSGDCEIATTKAYPARAPHRLEARSTIDATEQNGGPADTHVVVSAHQAAARFERARLSLAAPPPDAADQGTALTTRLEEASMAVPLRAMPLRAMMTRPTTGPAIAGPDAFASDGHPPGDFRLPTAWTRPGAALEPADAGLTPERHALIIRSVAAACLATAFGLVAWLGTTGGPAVAPPTMLAAPPSVPALPLTSGFAPPEVTQPRVSQANISTAQILAVAERFVATGEVLAARAMLEERAGQGEPRALFALAETYDPNLLASWNARDAEPSRTYARFLYEAARRGGITDAQTRLDALR